MEPNVTATNVEVAKPSLWGVITSPSLQFERMKQRAPIGLPMLLMAVLYAIIGALSAYFCCIKSGDCRTDAGRYAGGGTIFYLCDIRCDYGWRWCSHWYSVIIFLITALFL
ncbi:hypothetical protein GCM10020331_025130 [Ectobacillus funiculus]